MSPFRAAHLPAQQGHGLPTTSSARWPNIRLRAWFHCDNGFNLLLTTPPVRGPPPRSVNDSASWSLLLTSAPVPRRQFARMRSPGLGAAPRCVPSVGLHPAHHAGNPRRMAEALCGNDQGRERTHGYWVSFKQKLYRRQLLLCSQRSIKKKRVLTRRGPKCVVDTRIQRVADAAHLLYFPNAHLPTFTCWPILRDAKPAARANPANPIVCCQQHISNAAAALRGPPARADQHFLCPIHGVCHRRHQERQLRVSVPGPLLRPPHGHDFLSVQLPSAPLPAPAPSVVDESDARQPVMRDALISPE